MSDTFGAGAPEQPAACPWCGHPSTASAFCTGCGTPRTTPAPAPQDGGHGLRSTIPPDPRASAAAADFAALGQRVGGHLLDEAVGLLACLLVLVTLAVASAFALHLSAKDWTGAPHLVLFALLAVFGVLVPGTLLLYRTLGDLRTGRTLGRAAAGTRLVRVDAVGAPDAEAVGFLRSGARQVLGGTLNAVIGLNSWSALWRADRRTLADRATGTAVVRTAVSARGAGRTLATTAGVLVTTLAVAVVAADVAGPPLVAGQRSRAVAARSTRTSTHPAQASPTDPAPDPTPDPSTDPTRDPSTDSPTDTPGDPASVGIVTIDTSDPSATSVAQTLDSYFASIDEGDYDAAWNALSAREQAAAGSPAGFAQRLESTQDDLVTLLGVEHEAGSAVDADVSFTSSQDGADGPTPGETCTNWTLTYHLVPDPEGDGYRIDRALDAVHTACPEDDD